MGIGVVMVKIIIHCLDYRPRHLSAAGSVEIGNGITVMSAGERWETSPYFFNRFLRGGGGRTMVFL